MTTPPQTNLLLDSLSPESRGRVLALAKELDLPLRTPLQDQEESPRYCYFLTSGMASFVVTLPEGGSAEVMVAGREGMTDPFSLLGPARSPARCFIQVPASGFRVPFEKLYKLFRESEEIRDRMLQLVQQQGLTMAQIAACNKLHDSEARLARWLLMVQDRIDQDVLPLTQEFLAQMLGAQRTTVAVAAGTLQRSGFIDYKRGKVKILARPELEDAACDCYPVTRRLLRNLYQ